MRVTLNRILLITILLYPISTTIQGIPGLSIINQVSCGIVSVLCIISFFIDKLRVSTFWVLITSLLIIALSTYLTIGRFPVSFNLYTYLPLWIVYFCYLICNYNILMEECAKNIVAIKFTVLIWNVIVFVSFFVKSAYIYEGNEKYFVSFSRAEHIIAGASIIILVFLWILFKFGYRKYILLSVIPIIAILLCGARTYLGMAIIYLLAVYYQWINNKRKFYLTIIPLIIVATTILMVTPMGNRIFVTLEGEGYYGYSATLTSGRSIFWEVDLKAFLSFDFIHKLIGNGVSYVYEVNYFHPDVKKALWAHNDFINLLLSYGLIGLLIYIYTYFAFSRLLFKKWKVNWILRLSYYSIWFINAMFNMVYTYPVAFLIIPFIGYSFGLEYQNNIREKKK